MTGFHTGFNTGFLLVLGMVPTATAWPGVKGWTGNSMEEECQGITNREQYVGLPGLHRVKGSTCMDLNAFMDIIYLNMQPRDLIVCMIHLINTESHLPATLFFVITLDNN